MSADFVVRGRDLGLPFPGRTGFNNAITDVEGVAVGYTTLVEGEGQLVTGKGPVRTGVTAILPRGPELALNPVWAGYHALNGNGEMTGTHWIRDAGYFTGPVVLTNTHSVGIAHSASTRWMVERQKILSTEVHRWALPVIAETYDGVLNDINGFHVNEQHVISAIENAATGFVKEGNVGGGTGMICYDFKGGTGTSSRVIQLSERRYTVGALVQANHGKREWLNILGVPVGQYLTEDLILEKEQGSIIVVVATDAPMVPHQLSRVAKRIGLGVGRNGTPSGNSSGDIFLAFSVANNVTNWPMESVTSHLQFLNDEYFDPFYLATVEVVEEAIVNAMLAAKEMTTLRPPGLVCRAIDRDVLLDLVKRYGRVRR